jgi:hypothetical protein
MIACCKNLHDLRHWLGADLFQLVDDQSMWEDPLAMRPVTIQATTRDRRSRALRSYEDGAGVTATPPAVTGER